MAILYGDGSPSSLQFDYLGYLRRALAMAVEVVLVEDLLVVAARQRATLERKTRELEARLEALRSTVHVAVGSIARSPEDDPVTHCANHIESEVDVVVARATAGVHTQQEIASATIATRERKAHTTALDAVEGFLRAHDFPAASHETEWEAGPRSAVILRATTPYHVSYEVELDAGDQTIGLTRARAKELRLDRVVVAGARSDAREIDVFLRAGRDGAERVEVSLDRASGKLTVTGRLAEDEAAIATLASAVGTSLDGLATRRKRLRGVTIDDTPFDEHDRPSLLIDRVFAAMAPEVRTIVERSRTPGELSLRRETAKDRREEIFVTYATLLEVVAQVPVGRRRHFDALGIPGLASARPMTVDGIQLSDPSISVEIETDD